MELICYTITTLGHEYINYLWWATAVKFGTLTFTLFCLGYAGYKLMQAAIKDS